MKVSTKIYFVFVSLCFLLVSGGFAYLKLTNEVEPVEMVHAFKRKTYYPDNFNRIRVDKGEWKVKVSRSDTFNVTITGGDNMIDNYLDIRLEDSTLVLGLAEKISGNKDIYLIAEINIPEVKSIQGCNQSVFTLQNLNQEKLIADLYY